MLMTRRSFAAAPGDVTVAVTGASGYIGSYVVAELLSRGYAVNGLVRGCSSTPAKAKHLVDLPHAGQLLTLFDGGDLAVEGSFDEAFRGADAVVSRTNGLCVASARSHRCL